MAQTTADPPARPLRPRYLAAMKSARSIQFKPQHIIALIAVVGAGLIVGNRFGVWAGLAAALVVLAINEVIERQLRKRR